MKGDKKETNQIQKGDTRETQRGHKRDNRDTKRRQKESKSVDISPIRDHYSQESKGATL